jgi:putative tricarboxylic transport membrane protein
MTRAAVDRITGLALIAVAVLWCWAVIVTVPAADDPGRLGPRGFPFGLGVLLALLGAGLLVPARAAAGDGDADDGSGGRAMRAEVWAVVTSLALIVGYALAMEQVGFLIATAGIVAAALTLVLGLWRRPGLIIGLSVGMSLGVYLVFGKLLGVYLPHGQLIDLAF